MTSPPDLPFDRETDATGLMCPWPVLKAAKTLRAMPVGAVLCLSASDPIAVVDVPHFCAEEGHALLHTEAGTQAGVTRYFIRKG